MGRRQNISSGGRWKIGVICLVLFMGIASVAVWVMPQILRGAPVEKMTSTKGNAGAGDLILHRAMTSGIILSYSFQPWGGAVSHQPTERLCPRELGEHPAVRAGVSLTPSSRPGEIPKKDSHIKRSEGSFPSKSGPSRMEHAVMKQHLHRT